jgi:hypothetical protein
MKKMFKETDTLLSKAQRRLALSEEREHWE